MKIKIILLMALLTAWSAVGFTQSIMARQLEFSKPIEVNSSTATGKALTNYLMPFLCKVNTQAAALRARSLRLYKRSSKYQ
jgi:hypothetical protein